MVRTAQQIIEAQVGNLVVNNASLLAQNDELKEKVAELENKLKQFTEGQNVKQPSTLVRSDAELAGRISSGIAGGGEIKQQRGN